MTGKMTLRIWDFDVPEDIYVLSPGASTEHLVTEEELERAREAVEDFKAEYWADDADYSHREMRKADPEISAMCGKSWTARQRLNPMPLTEYIEKWIQGRLSSGNWHPNDHRLPRGEIPWSLDGGFESLNQVLSPCGNCMRSYRAKYGEEGASWKTDPEDPTEVTIEVSP